MRLSRCRGPFRDCLASEGWCQVTGDECPHPERARSFADNALPATDRMLTSDEAAEIDQILANLCVNARDAIDGVGRITIETQNELIDDDFCASHAESVPGYYAMLAVSDDGCGMEKEVLARLFEPFFTTKDHST